MSSQGRVKRRINNNNNSNGSSIDAIAHLPEIHQFLDGFYMSRIGIRILIGQHVALHEPPKKIHRSRCRGRNL